MKEWVAHFLSSVAVWLHQQAASRWNVAGLLKFSILCTPDPLYLEVAPRPHMGTSAR